MKRFLVVKGFDAYVKYATVVEAATGEDAEDIASDDRYSGPWFKHGVSEFDDNKILKDETIEVGPDFQGEDQTFDIAVVTKPERDIIIAALRLWQRAMTIPSDIASIAENGSSSFLSDEDIDRLIEDKLNA